MYIGITCNLKERWHPGSYKGCTAFYEAIEEFGWDNFEHIVLIDGITKSMALECETALILKYNTHYRQGNGYNVLIQPNDYKNVKKKKGVPVYQYSL